MELVTILNRCYKHKSFIYGKTWFVKDTNEIRVEVIARKNSKAVCSNCGKQCSGYDTLPERAFEFIPFWGFRVFFYYARRRVNCKNCGVVAEKIPWSEGRNHLTKAYMQYLANWSRELSWKDVARSFHTSWGKVYKSVEYVVNRDLDHRDLSKITAIGIDEIQWHRGHKYLILAYQINTQCVRLLWIGKDRTEETFSKFFDDMGSKRSELIEFVCSDMWKPYRKVIKNRISSAVHILDRFHIVARLNKALDEVRAGEHRKMKAGGYEPLLSSLSSLQAARNSPYSICKRCSTWIKSLKY